MKSNYTNPLDHSRTFLNIEKISKCVNDVVINAILTKYLLGSSIVGHYSVGGHVPLVSSDIG